MDGDMACIQCYCKRCMKCMCVKKCVTETGIEEQRSTGHPVSSSLNLTQDSLNYTNNRTWKFQRALCMFQDAMPRVKVKDINWNR